MLGLTAIFVVIGASAAVDFQSLRNDFVDPEVLPYYESYTAFAQVRLYLQQNVPVENGSFNNPEVQRHRVAGLLVAVTDALVEAWKNRSAKNPYDPLKVVDEALPQAWSEYNTRAARPLNKLLSVASAKIKPVTDLINSLCITKTIEDCNREVDIIIWDGSDDSLIDPGLLLVNIGDVLEPFLSKKDDIEDLLNEALSVLEEVRSADFTRFVKELSIVIDDIRATTCPSDVN